MLHDMTYTVRYDDGCVKVDGSFPLPERLPMPGDEYAVTREFWTLANIHYRAGDRFTVLERTHFAPHHRVSSLGNLLIRCKQMTSVWTNFDSAVAEGHVELVASKSAGGH